MSAHHVKHALGCPSYGNGELARCICGAPGSANAQKLVTKADVVDAIDRGAEVARSRIGSGYPGGGVERRSKEEIDRELADQLEERRRNASAITEQITEDRRAAREADIVADLMALAPSVEYFDDNPEFDEAEELGHAPRIRKVALAIGDLLGRRVALHLELRRGGVDLDPPTLTVRQKCRVCRADIECRVPEGKTEMATIAVAGAAARTSYLKHVCDPVERALLGFTWEELEELRQAMERDCIRIAERCAEIEKLERARK